MGKFATYPAVAGAGINRAADLVLIKSGGATKRTTPNDLAYGLQSSLGFINVVTDFGAVGDGVADDTTPMQNALDAAEALGGGTVFCPQGQYRLTDTLVQGMGVGLFGMRGGRWNHVQAASTGMVTPLTVGTVFVIDHGNGGNAPATTDEGDVFITGAWGVELTNNSTIGDIAFYYPDNTTGLSVPKMFPFTIACTGDNCGVYNCELMNSYQGVYFTYARATIQGLTGSPLLCGVYNNISGDVSRVVDVQFVPCFDAGTALGTWVKANGMGAVWGRSDMLFVERFFAFEYNFGMSFIATVDGTCWGTFTQCGFDNCNYDIVVRDSNSNGLIFSACWFAISGDAGGQAHVYIDASNHGNITLTGCTFAALGGASPYSVLGVGSSRLIVDGCVFSLGAAPTNGTIRIQGGGTFAAINGNNFTFAAANHIVTTDVAVRGVATGNVANGGLTTSLAGALFLVPVGTNF